MITIIDYGAGNIKSIKNMLLKLGNEALITNSKDDILKAEKLILPGVGHFDHGMKALRNSGLEEALNQRVKEDKVPLLGICLGAQLLGKSSEEGDEAGLAWIDMEVVKFNQNLFNENLKIPHMGWNYIQSQNTSPLIQNLPKDPRFYFVHNYHMQCYHKEDILCTTQYGYEFTSVVAQNNVFGVQFHPEKSHVFGMRILENFSSL